MQDSGIARVAGVLFSPIRTFEAIRQRPTWLAPVAILILLGMLGGYLVSGRLDVEEVVRSSIANSGRQLSEEQIERAIGLQEKLTPVLALGGPVVVYTVGSLLMAVLFWICLKLLGGELSFKSSFATVAHGLVPGGVASLLTVPVLLSREVLSYEQVRTGSILASNAGFFASADSSPALLSLLSSLDLFSLWTVVLLSIGYSVVAGVSRAKAAAVVVGLWIVYIGLKVGAAAVFS